MWKSVLTCFAVGSIAGVVAVVADTQATIAEALFVIFFLAGMVLIAFGGSRHTAGQHTSRSVFGRSA